MAVQPPRDRQRGGPEEDTAPVVLIGPRPGFRSWARDLWQYRGALAALAVRDVRSKYKRAALGIAWAVIQPAAQTALFTAVFHGVGGAGGAAPYAVGLLAALVPFNLFQQIVSHGCPALVAQQAIVTKVYFPRIYTVAAAGSHALVNAAISVVLLAGLMAAYGVSPGPRVLAMLPLLALAAIMAFGLAAALGALNVRLRDVQHALPLAMTVLLFLSPVFYPVDRLPEAARAIARWNPLSPLLEAARASVVGGEFPSAIALGGSAAAATGLCVAGLWVFERMQARLVDHL